MHAVLEHIVTDRNVLVHRFLQDKEAALRTVEGIRAAIAELDEQHARAKFALDVATVLSATSMLDLIERGRLSEREREELLSVLVAAVTRLGWSVQAESMPEANGARR